MHIDQDDDIQNDDIAVVRLRGGKANAMDPAFLDQLVRLVDQAEAGARALVLTGYESYFSAGLALPVLVDLDRAAMSAFIDRFARAMKRVLCCDVPVVAAINGHAVAGGCVLALQCDVRIMAQESGRIGLTEVQLGIGLPAVVFEVLRLRVPAASIVPIALEGRLFAPDDALAHGLIDEAVAPEMLLARAMERASTLAALPAAGIAQVKAAWRRPALEAIERYDEAEREAWLDTWFSPGARARLTQAVSRLRTR